MPTAVRTMRKLALSGVDGDGVRELRNLDKSRRIGENNPEKTKRYTIKDVAEDRGNMKVVSIGRAYLLKETDNQNEKTLTAVYQGQLTRELIAMIVIDVMKHQKLSLRGAEAKTKLAKSQIQKIRAGKASIDSGLSFLSDLGCKLDASLETSNVTQESPDLE